MMGQAVTGCGISAMRFTSVLVTVLKREEHGEHLEMPDAIQVIPDYQGGHGVKSTAFAGLNGGGDASIFVIIDA